jgi:hypothetical protein
MGILILSQMILKLGFPPFVGELSDVGIRTAHLNIVPTQVLYEHPLK